MMTLWNFFTSQRQTALTCLLLAAVEPQRAPKLPQHGYASRTCLCRVPLEFIFLSYDQLGSTWTDIAHQGIMSDSMIRRSNSSQLEDRLVFMSCLKRRAEESDASPKAAKRLVSRASLNIWFSCGVAVA